MKLTFYYFYYSSTREIFCTKIEPNIRFLQRLSQETELSHLMNSSNYFIGIQINSIYFITLRIEKQNVSGAITSLYEYFKVSNGCFSLLFKAIIILTMNQELIISSL